MMMAKTKITAVSSRVNWPTILNDACRLIEIEAPKLESLAAKLGVSRAELQRQFTRRLGVSPKAYAQALALHRMASGAAAGRTALNVPLDIQGTAFQSRVWRALRQIPLGKTVSYGEIARQLGDPRAGRAVASACARNRAALLIPCHRVVAHNGDLAGYRWGEERKRILLEREAADREGR